MSISFCHVINPFPAKKDSEHDIASRITYESLRIAVQQAGENDIPVDVKAIIYKGDEASIQIPAILGGYLERSIQDLKPLQPKRVLPFISDILSIGESVASSTTHVIFTNMDISVHPDFYVKLKNIIENKFSAETPFIVYRRNISNQFRNIDQLTQMYLAPGQLAYGFDCFVIPKKMIPKLDLGNCCIGAAHFDYLLFMALDAVSGFNMKRINDPSMTFHIGNQIEWSGNLDYIEHNLHESLGAIRRMRHQYQIKAGSDFEKIERLHFLPNNRIDSKILRKIKRLPYIGNMILSIKRKLGRSH